MEKTYNYTEKSPKSDIKIIKNEKPNIVLSNIFSIKKETSKNIENLELSFCKKLILGRSIFSKKGFKRFFGIAKNNEKIEQIGFSSLALIGITAIVSFFIFMLTSIDFSVAKESTEVVAQPKTLGELTDEMSYQFNQMANIMFPLIGTIMFFIGLFSLKRFADDPRQHSLMKGMVFIMAGSVLLSFTTLTSMVAQ